MRLFETKRRRQAFIASLLAAGVLLYLWFSIPSKIPYYESLRPHDLERGSGVLHCASYAETDCGISAIDCVLYHTDFKEPGEGVTYHCMTDTEVLK